MTRKDFYINMLVDFGILFGAGFPIAFIGYCIGVNS